MNIGGGGRSDHISWLLVGFYELDSLEKGKELSTILNVNQPNWCIENQNFCCSFNLQCLRQNDLLSLIVVVECVGRWLGHGPGWVFFL